MRKVLLFLCFSSFPSLLILSSCSQEKESNPILKTSKFFDQAVGDQISQDSSKITWKEISNQTFWKNKELFNGSYFFPSISFSYPNTWKFSCCNDTDTFSQHIISPKEINKLDQTKDPFIKVKSYSNKVHVSGNQDNPIFLTPIEYINTQTGFTLANKSQRIYQNKNIKSYQKIFVISDNGMISIDFINMSDDKNQDIAHEFINKIRTNR